MSKPYVYYWAPSEGEGYQDGIALLQSRDDGSNLTLVSNTPNGVFSYINTLNPNTTNNSINSNIIRSISITSGGTPNDDVTFIISGIGSPKDANGNPTGVIGPISEPLVGPAADTTVTSENIYTTIDLIAVTEANAVDVMVGYGPNGITNYYELDCNRTSIQGYGTTYSVQVIPSPTLTLGNIVYVSLNKPESPNINGSLDPFGLVNGNQITFIPAYEYTADNPPGDTSYYNIVTTGFQIIWINVTNTGTDSLFFTVMQQGI